MRLINLALCVPFLCPAARAADEAALLQQVLDRLAHLEQQNNDLAAQVRDLRAQLEASSATAAPSPPAAPTIPERVAVVEQRTADLDQVKVESSQRFPISITGMALFNAFSNGRDNGGLQQPPFASLSSGASTSGATFRQTIFGLSFHGPETFLGAHVSGNVEADFAAGSGLYSNYGFRLRTGTVQLDWADQTVMVGVDRPLISPRSPDSLAEVAEPALAAAGNLWFWQPQVRFEQRFSLGDEMGIRAQAALYQTNETAYYQPAAGQPTPEAARPGYQGRVEFWRHSGGRRFEIAPGFHASVSHIGGLSIPSRIFSVDWLVAPLPKLEFTGEFFDGSNFGGLGAAGPGFAFHSDPGAYLPYAVAVHSSAGWAQLSILATSRLTFHLFGGEQDNRGADLGYSGIAANRAFAANAYFRLAPNVLAGLEAIQYRTTYAGQGTRLLNRYDLALAYLF